MFDCSIVSAQGTKKLVQRQEIIQCHPQVPLCLPFAKRQQILKPKGALEFRAEDYVRNL